MTGQLCWTRNLQWPKMLSHTLGTERKLPNKTVLISSLKSSMMAVIILLCVGGAIAKENSIPEQTNTAPPHKAALLQPSGHSISNTSSSAGVYPPPSGVAGNITKTGIVNLSWKPPAVKQAENLFYEVWMACPMKTSGSMSAYRQLNITSSFQGRFEVLPILKKFHVETNTNSVKFVLFKIRAVSANQTKTGNFSKPFRLSLSSLSPPEELGALLPPRDLEANLTTNGTIILKWKSPVNESPAENIGYEVWVAYGTKSRAEISKYKELETTTSTKWEQDVGRLLRHIVDDSEDELVSFLMFKVRAMAMTQKSKTPIKGNYTEAVLVKIRVKPTLQTTPKKQKTWIYIVAPLGGVGVALVIILGVYCHRQYRIRKSYMSYIRTQYDTESEALSVSNENFGLDPDSQPQIRFSDEDDESLIVA